MKYRTLGKTGLVVSVIGVGTWQLGGEWGKDFLQDEVDEMFAAARQHGINLIDTAECYGDHTSERLVGRAIQAHREQWIVCTKFGHKFHGPFNRTEPRTPDDIFMQVDDSLAALKTDYIDVLQFHSWGDDTFFNDDVQRACEQLLDSGKVRHMGNSIGSNENISQTAASSQYKIEIIQLIYNRLDRAPENRVFASCIEQNLGVLARVPLASGFLSGKYKPGATFADGDVRSRWKSPTPEQRIAEAQKIAAEEVPPGVPMSQWALAWCLRHPAVSAVIPGCKSVEQVEANAKAADLEMVHADHPQAWRGV